MVRTRGVTSTIAKETPILHKGEDLIAESHKYPVGLLKTEDAIRYFYKLALHFVHEIVHGNASRQEIQGYS
jgi:hypothetical protein